MFCDIFNTDSCGSFIYKIVTSYQELFKSNPEKMTIFQSKTIYLYVNKNVDTLVPHVSRSKTHLICILADSSQGLHSYNNLGLQPSARKTNYVFLPLEHVWWDYPYLVGQESKGISLNTKNWHSRADVISLALQRRIYHRTRESTQHHIIDVFRTFSSVNSIDFSRRSPGSNQTDALGILASAPYGRLISCNEYWSASGKGTAIGLIIVNDALLSRIPLDSGLGTYIKYTLKFKQNKKKTRSYFSASFLC